MQRDSDRLPLISAPAFRRGWLPIWFHFVLCQLSALAGFFLAGIFGAAAINHYFAIPAHSLLSTAVLAVVTLVGVALPPTLISKLIPARCPRCRGICQQTIAPTEGHRRSRFYDTFKYRCFNCGEVVDTHVNTGD